MSRDVDAAGGIHVRVNRMVVDRAALGDSGVRGLREAVARRIAHRFEGTDSASDGTPGSRPDLSDVIATAVAEQVPPRVSLARRR
jgi:hypothetical protein